MSPFEIKFLNSLDRWDIEDLTEICFRDNTIHVRREDGDWLAVASLAEQKVYKEFTLSDQFDYGFKVLRVSDGRSGVGRYQLDGANGAERETIWDNVECVQGDCNGLFVYARGRGRGFHLDWVSTTEGAGWQYRDGRLGEPRPVAEGPIFSEIRLFRHQPALTRTRASSLAG